jgi:hypothetical protein
MKIRNPETQYFKISEKKSATARPRKQRIYEVLKKPHGYRMGLVKYFGAWRQFCFFSDPDQAFNQDCLRLVATFLDEANEDLKP